MNGTASSTDFPTDQLVDLSHTVTVSVNVPLDKDVVLIARVSPLFTVVVLKPVSIPFLTNVALPPVTVAVTDASKPLIIMVLEVYLVLGYASRISLKAISGMPH